MNVLLDANLSWRLKASLQPYFEGVWHVESTDLTQPAKDIEIWEFAKSKNLMIFTNDEDFYKLSIIKGFPPKVLIFRMGNQSRQNILEIIVKHLDEIHSFNESSEYGLLEII